MYSPVQDNPDDGLLSQALESSLKNHRTLFLQASSLWQVKLPSEFILLSATEQDFFFLNK